VLLPKAGAGAPNPPNPLGAGAGAPNPPNPVGAGAGAPNPPNPLGAGAPKGDGVGPEDPNAGAGLPKGAEGAPKADVLACPKPPVELPNAGADDVDPKAGVVLDDAPNMVLFLASSQIYCCFLNELNQTDSSQSLNESMLPLTFAEICIIVFFLPFQVSEPQYSRLVLNAHQFSIDN